MKGKFITRSARKPNRGAARPTVSAEEVRRAVEAFKARGGLIRKLPDEVALPRTRVGLRGTGLPLPGGWESVDAEVE